MLSHPAPRYALALTLGIVASPAPAQAAAASPPPIAIALDGGEMRDARLSGGAQDDGQSVSPATLDAAAAAADAAAGGHASRVPRDYLGIGIGLISVPDYNGSNTRRRIPGGLIRARISGYAISSRGTNLQVDVLRQVRGADTDWKLGPIINIRSDRARNVHDPIVALLGERGTAIEAGLFAGVSHNGVITSAYDQLGARVTFLQDVSGEHGSWILSPTIDYGTPLSRQTFVGLSASLNIYGPGFGAHYFDIDAAGAARSGLPIYARAGDHATLGKATFGVALAHAISGDLRHGLLVVGGAQYGRLLGSYAQSPIVATRGDADQWIGGLGLAYQF